MPIILPESVTPLSRDEFHQLDHKVLGLAFGVHNEMGQCFDEPVYHAVLRERCREHGLDVRSEFHIKLEHSGFIRPYYLDLLIGGAPYELKAVQALTARHEAQLLNYLMLLGVHHGSLINFRGKSVVRRFVTTMLTPALRRDFDIVFRDWTPIDPIFDRLVNFTESMLADWGRNLQIELYRDALMHLACDGQQLSGEVAVHINGRTIAKQPLDMISERHALLVTGLKSPGAGWMSHYKRMLNQTDLDAFAWINFHGRTVTFTTIK